MDPFSTILWSLNSTNHHNNSSYCLLDAIYARIVLGAVLLIHNFIYFPDNRRGKYLYDSILQMKNQAEKGQEAYPTSLIK